MMSLIINDKLRLTKLILNAGNNNPLNKDEKQQRGQQDHQSTSLI